MSAPALSTWVLPSTLVHCSMPPTPLVGTFWSVARRTTLRRVAAFVTARKLKCERCRSRNTWVCSVLLSGNCAWAPRLPDVHSVSFTSPTLALVRFSANRPTRRKVCRRSDGSNSILAVRLAYSTSALLSIGPRSRGATIGKPLVSRALPSTATPTRFQRSLAKKSTFGVLRLPYCVCSCRVRRVGRPVTTLITPPMAMLPYRLDAVSSVISI